MTKQILLIGVLLCSLIAKEDEQAGEKAELRQQIAKYESDIENLNKKIEENRREAASEKSAHESYRTNFQKDVNRDSEELAKLSDEYKGLQNSADSLSRVIAGKQYEIKELTMKGETFKQTLLSALNTYAEALRSAPAPIVEKDLNSLTFLENEIKSGAVENAEAVERLWQITQTVSDHRSDVDVWSGRSTFETIQGQVHYIRIGYAWLGCVNDDATQGAIWQWSDNQSGWKELTEPAQISAVRNAVKIRNGNKLPEILGLPIVYSSETEETDEN